MLVQRTARRREDRPRPARPRSRSRAADGAAQGRDRDRDVVRRLNAVSPRRSGKRAYPHRKARGELTAPDAPAGEHATPAEILAEQAADRPGQGLRQHDADQEPADRHLPHARRAPRRRYRRGRPGSARRSSAPAQARSTVRAEDCRRKAAGAGEHRVADQRAQHQPQLAEAVSRPGLE